MGKYAGDVFQSYPEPKRGLWGGEFWENGYFVRTVSENVTKDIIKKNIEYDKKHEKSPKQLKLL